jgi:Ca2+-binding RTX toxin-like protein
VIHFSSIEVLDMQSTCSEIKIDTNALIGLDAQLSTITITSVNSTNLHLDAVPSPGSVSPNLLYDIKATSVGITRITDATKLLIDYSHIGSLEVNSFDSDATFNVDRVDAATPLTINTGAGDHTFALFPHIAGSLTINAGGGTNTLDYSAYSSGVYVNLQTLTATDLASFSGIQNVTAGAGNSILVGDKGNNVLRAIAGRNLLIGGGGNDTLYGGSGEDILISGTTLYDTNRTALEAILAEWSSDLDYATRIEHLQFGGGTSPYLLNTDTVFDGGGTSSLVGGQGRHWFFLTRRDLLFDWDPETEQLVFIQAAP